MGFYPQKSPKNGDGDGDRTPERFGDTLGTGKTQSLGIFWGKIPKKPQKTGRGRGKDSRGFCPPYLSPTENFKVTEVQSHLTNRHVYVMCMYVLGKYIAETFKEEALLRVKLFDFLGLKIHFL